MNALRRVAIVGSGISGLAAAHALHGLADVTLFEAGNYFGGHTHTVDVTLPGEQGLVSHGVDTGFLVFNERTYPQLIHLFAELGVETAKSDMSFSVKVPGASKAANSPGLEWSGASLNSVFAQRGNLANWKFLRMLRDVVRFNRITTQLAESGADADAAMLQPLSEFLRAEKFSVEFRDWYFLPMMGCIWSCPTDQMLQFPVATMIRFCHNHGLIQITNRPQWWTVKGGARHYVEKIIQRIADKRLNTPVRWIERDADGVTIATDGQIERFDKVVLAAHSDQSLALLRDANPIESAVLSAIRYQANRAVLHTDVSVLPQKKLAWAAWNYERAQDQGRESARVCLHYLLNKLQPLPFKQPVVVSLNPTSEIERKHIMGEFEYTHPVFDAAAIRAQKELPKLQGLQHTYFCGAWTGYGFHEDGLKSGLQAAKLLLEQPTEATV
ncbi:MAG: FAD-dependent oxidoreductase [Polaromonas sp.]|uniref:NAD(P)/FAD-dependent oxidoreductase n=1 Tax=Polaromonas sp. TaxID=1869339 RepID=UPI00179C5DFA|nr:FAD-dependent oxidoreductase [Polaromonas sp.]NMM09702.1 FAD-dependent oxidoreductase [Polaromonas sp.]